MGNRAAHLAGAAPQHPSLLLQRRRTATALPSKAMEKAEQNRGGKQAPGGRPAEFKGSALPCRKSKLGGKRLFRRKKSCTWAESYRHGCSEVPAALPVWPLLRPKMQHQGGLTGGQLLPAMLELPI